MHSLSYELCFPSRVCPVLIVFSKLQYALAGNIRYPFRVTSSIILIKWTLQVSLTMAGLKLPSKVDFSPLSFLVDSSLSNCLEFPPRLF